MSRSSSPFMEAEGSLESTLSQLNPVHAFIPYIFMIRFNVILQSTLRPLKLFTISRLKFCRHSSLPHACYMPCLSHINLMSKTKEEFVTHLWLSWHFHWRKPQQTLPRLWLGIEPHTFRIQGRRITVQQNMINKKWDKTRIVTSSLNVECK
jgi:hypothetical protein